MKLTGSDIYLIKGKIRKLCNMKLDMKDAGVPNLRKIVEGTRVPYVTAVKWKEQIMHQEKLKRLRKRILG